MAAGVSESSFAHYFEWTYSGVDHSLPGNGGQDCIDFIPTTQKIFETVIFICLGLLEIYLALPGLHLPRHVPVSKAPEPTGKKVLLVLMTLTFGTELGFKLATRQMIWILNPCHLVTAMQIYLLAAPPTRLTMAVFRCHMHCLSGAIIAILFPVINTRLLPFETEVYYIQHILMLVIPFYLIRQGGVYSPESFSNFSWASLSIGLLFVYHFTLMQSLAMLSLVNLNNMTCPAVSDPFYGRWYRIWAAAHQTLVLFLHGKLLTWICLRLWPPRCKAVTGGDGEETTNGHAKAH